MGKFNNNETPRASSGNHTPAVVFEVIPHYFFAPRSWSISFGYTGGKEVPTETLVGACARLVCVHLFVSLKPFSQASWTTGSTQRTF